MLVVCGTSTLAQHGDDRPNAGGELTDTKGLRLVGLSRSSREDAPQPVPVGGILQLDLKARLTSRPKWGELARDWLKDV